jgi:hypothetical protein
MLSLARERAAAAMIVDDRVCSGPGPTDRGGYWTVRVAVA